MPHKWMVVLAMTVWLSPYPSTENCCLLPSSTSHLSVLQKQNYWSDDYKVNILAGDACGIYILMWLCAICHRNSVHFKLHRETVGVRSGAVYSVPKLRDHFPLWCSALLILVQSASDSVPGFPHQLPIHKDMDNKNYTIFIWNYLFPCPLPCSSTCTSPLSPASSSFLLLWILSFRTSKLTHGPLFSSTHPGVLIGVRTLWAPTCFHQGEVFGNWVQAVTWVNDFECQCFLMVQHCMKPYKHIHKPEYVRGKGKGSYSLG